MLLLLLLLLLLYIIIEYYVYIYIPKMITIVMMTHYDNNDNDHKHDNHDNDHQNASMFVDASTIGCQTAGPRSWTSYGDGCSRGALSEMLGMGCWEATMALRWFRGFIIFIDYGYWMILRIFIDYGYLWILDDIGWHWIISILDDVGRYYLGWHRRFLKLRKHTSIGWKKM